ncbi:nucleoside 2-deoxyribosyltransferase [Paraburkholderia rhynchosiae]|uniref:nucleoside 2-deoxyribosyltransferase n=1 Tax=Paraburkholderia rhynchosiae TaxID=487049 RepID=UPI001FC9396C|nr:nucleoside 2-deoxyribosyltransferase [Paraburkholderia rhynchosiae]
MMARYKELLAKKEQPEGEPDRGTAFEIGFAASLGKPISACRDDLSALRERCRALRQRSAMFASAAI